MIHMVNRKSNAVRHVAEMRHNAFSVRISTFITEESADETKYLGLFLSI